MDHICRLRGEDRDEPRFAGYRRRGHQVGDLFLAQGEGVLAQPPCSSRWTWPRAVNLRKRSTVVEVFESIALAISIVFNPGRSLSMATIS
jgi:hypothetical protein